VNFSSGIIQSLLFAVCPRRRTKKLLHYMARLSSSPFLFRGAYGLFYLLRARDDVDNNIVRYGVHEAESVAGLIDQVRKSHADIFLDIGSNLGSYALAVAKETECRKIIAFEPDPFNRAHLYANIFLNGFEDLIHVFNEAISDTKGEATLYAARKAKGTHKENTGSSSLEPPYQDRDPHRTHTVKIQTDRLDNLLRSVKGKVIVVKMDIEGHESKALEGMAHLLNNNQVWLQIEILPAYTDSTRTALHKHKLIELPQIVPGSCDFIFISPSRP
jgi:FkbM family methyltransferase